LTVVLLGIVQRNGRIAQPTRGPQFHTKEFNTGYNAGLRACGNVLEGVPADQLLQGDNDNDHDQNQGKAQESKSSSASGSTSSSSASNNNQIIINNNIQSKELKTGKALGFREEPTQSACAGLEGTEGDNGYDQGYVDAHVHFSKHTGFDSDPGNRHSAEYNKQYVNGYNDGWVNARNGVQDPKC
jgi:hypothetical protein